MLPSKRYIYHPDGRLHKYQEFWDNGQKAKESWVCDICNKNTYNVEWDYIGSGTNHLGCELKMEMGHDPR